MWNKNHLKKWNKLGYCNLLAGKSWANIVIYYKNKVWSLKLDSNNKEHSPGVTLEEEEKASSLL